MLTKDELFRKDYPPAVQDRRMAARVASLFSLLFALWFFGSPQAYFGVLDQPSALNDLLIGGLILTAGSIRLIWPQGTSGFSVMNVVLGLWILISPFVFGYTSQTSYMVNTLVVGAVITVCSLLSFLISRDAKRQIQKADQWMATSDV